MTAGRPAAPQAARAALPIDPRIRQRRVAVTREEGRRRLSILLSVLGVTALGAVAVGIAHSPFLSVNQVQVVGAKATDPADVVQAAGLDRRPLMIHVDGGLVDRRVGRLSWIATVHTERHWPSTVRLVVTERAPVAQAAAGSQWAMVDRTGRVLSLGDREPSLVAVGGIPAPGPPGTRLGRPAGDALLVATRLPAELRPAVGEVDVLDGPEVELRLRTGGLIRLGPVTNLPDKLVAAVTVLAKVDAHRLRVLDVRVPEAPVLTRG